MTVLLIILLTIAVFGVLNTLSMSFFERTREVGTMRALGYRTKDIFWMLFGEVLVLGFCGVLLGWLLGTGFAYYIANVGISYGSDFADMATFPFQERLLGEMGWHEYVGTFFVGMITAIIGGVVPVIRICRMKIVDALRFV